MKQLTVRGLEEDLSEHLQRIAQAQGISLSRAARQLLRKGAGLPHSNKSRGDKRSADREPTLSSIVAGTMTQEEAENIREAVAYFHVIDEEKWQ